MKNYLLLITGAVLILVFICASKVSSLFMYNTLNMYLNLALIVCCTLSLAYMVRKTVFQNTLLVYVIITVLTINAFSSFLEGLFQKLRELDGERENMSFVVTYPVLLISSLIWAVYWKQRINVEQNG